MGEIAKERIGPVWGKHDSSLPVATCQIRTVSSADPVAIRGTIGKERDAMDVGIVAGREQSLSSGFHFPQANHVVSALRTLTSCRLAKMQQPVPAHSVTGHSGRCYAW